MSCCNYNKKINDINNINYTIPINKMEENYKWDSNKNLKKNYKDSKENYMYMNTYGSDNSNYNVDYVNNYCTFYNNGQRQAVLALQDTDNPLTYKAFLS